MQFNKIIYHSILARKMFISCIVLTTVFLFLYFLLKRNKYISSLPPGPKGWPFVGNIFQINPVDPRITFVEWHKKYGPIYTVWLGMEPNIFVTGFDLMQDLFIKRADEFSDRPDSFLFDLFTKGKYVSFVFILALLLRTIALIRRFGIANVNGDQWREQRRFSHQTLRNFGVGRKMLEEKIETETQSLIQSIDEQLGDCRKINLNIKPYISVCISNIISSIMLGRTYSTNDPNFHKLKSGLEEVFRAYSSTPVQMLNSFPWLRFVPILEHFGYDKLTKYIDHFLGTVADELEQHKKDLDNVGEANDFIAAYLQGLYSISTSKNIFVCLLLALVVFEKHFVACQPIVFTCNSDLATYLMWNVCFLSCLMTILLKVQYSSSRNSITSPRCHFNQPNHHSKIKS